jgi:LAO/AO transport system kinase
MAEAANSTQDSLAERLLAGDKRALARAISLVENRDAEGIGCRRAFPAPKARIVGSRATGGRQEHHDRRLIAELRGRSRRGVPRSTPEPVHAGRDVGDRIRLADHF